MTKAVVEIVQLRSSGRLPARATSNAAGFDLFAAERVVIPGIRVTSDRANVGHALVPTGIAIAIPDGCVGRIGARSGLSARHNIEVGAGWIDADYRGEVSVELKNLGSEDFVVEIGPRIAQLIVLRLADIAITEVENLPETQRGSAGFGSTGTS